MKRKIFPVCLLILISLLVLSGCQKELPTNDDSTVTTTEAVTTTATPVPKDIELVVDGNALYTVVVSESVDIEAFESEISSTIISKVKEATGVELKAETDFLRADQSYDPDKYEILIGMTNRPESAEVANGMGYDDYSVAVKGNKVVILAFCKDGYTNAISRLVSVIKQNGTDGNLVISENIESKGEVYALKIFDGVPLLDESMSASVANLADDNYMVYDLGRTVKDYEDYCTKMTKSGFELYASHEIGENKFSSFKRDGKVVTCYFADNDDSVRIIAEPDDFKTHTEKESYTKVCDPAFRIVGLEYYGKDEDGDYRQNGLFMLWRLSDGRLVVVDSGTGYSTMSKKIYDTLYDMSPDKENIKVAAWIFTHAHGDHIGGFLEFAEGVYAKKVTVENFIYNFPTYDVYDNFETGKDRGRIVDSRSTLKQKYAKVNTIKAHSGQVLCFADMEIEMLYTPDDMIPMPYNRHNSTSLVFRVNIAGNSFMVLGDAYTTTSDLLVARYGASLKSDIVQVAHHGYVGGTVELYKAIDADIIFWPVGDQDYVKNLKKTYNSYIANPSNYKASYNAGGKREYTFTLPNDYLKADEEKLAA